MTDLTNAEREIYEEAMSEVPSEAQIEAAHKLLYGPGAAYTPVAFRAILAAIQREIGEDAGDEYMAEVALALGACADRIALAECQTV